MATTHQRTFTATDDAATAARLRPSRLKTRSTWFPSVPADYTVECSDEMPMDDATASDNCSEVSITVTRRLLECRSNYTMFARSLRRTPVATAHLRARRSSLKTRDS